MFCDLLLIYYCVVDHKQIPEFIGVNYSRVESSCKFQLTNSNILRIVINLFSGRVQIKIRPDPTLQSAIRV
jgi:hypothetical protein